MAKFYGLVGYYTGAKEVTPGVWVNTYDERNYYGTILKDARDWDNGGSINDNLTVANRISILADPYAYKNLGAMRYIKLYGQYWLIRSVEISRPRLVLTLGGAFTDEQADSAREITESN